MVELCRHHHAGDGLAAADHALDLPLRRLIPLRDRGHGRLRAHVHDLVALLLELIEQGRQRLGGRLLEVVHQDDALALPLELGHHRLDDVVGLAHFEIEAVEVVREDRDVALTQIGELVGRVLQEREAEERSDRLP